MKLTEATSSMRKQPVFKIIQGIAQKLECSDGSPLYITGYSSTVMIEKQGHMDKRSLRELADFCNALADHLER